MLDDPTVRGERPERPRFRLGGGRHVRILAVVKRACWHHLAALSGSISPHILVGEDQRRNGPGVPGNPPQIAQFRDADSELDACSLRNVQSSRPAEHGVIGGDGGESNSPSRTLRRRPLRACPMVCRRPPGRASALCRTVQSCVPRSGLTPDYVTLARIAAPLNDASTTREAEVASTLTLPPKRRERESAGGCQVLRFAA